MNTVRYFSFASKEFRTTTSIICLVLLLLFQFILDKPPSPQTVPILLYGRNVRLDVVKAIMGNNIITVSLNPPSFSNGHTRGVTREVGAVKEYMGKCRGLGNY